jgi:TGF-beta propeptide
MASTNYNNYPRISSTAWTHTSSLATYRNLLKFDLSTIPVGTTVQSATLYLYSDPANTSGEFSNSGTNLFSLQKVTQAWTASTVTWNNQPASTTTGRVTVAQSTSATENISVNITTLVQGMVSSPTTNYGLLLRLATETASRSRIYARQQPYQR